MKTNKPVMNLVEKATLIMLGERPIEETTLQKMFDRYVNDTTQAPTKNVDSAKLEQV